jgi:hypothetical protein
MRIDYFHTIFVNFLIKNEIFRLFYRKPEIFGGFEENKRENEKNRDFEENKNEILFKNREIPTLIDNKFLHYSKSFRYVINNFKSIFLYLFRSNIIK